LPDHDALVAAAEEALAGGYLRVLDGSHLPGPVYALILSCYFDGDTEHQFVVPPVVQLEAKRRWAIENDRLDELWWPYDPRPEAYLPGVDFPMELEVGPLWEDEAVLRPCRAVLDAIHADEAWELFDRVMLGVAARLTAADWGDRVPRAEEFVVVACDLDGGDVRASLERSLGPVRYERWRQRAGGVRPRVAAPP